MAGKKIGLILALDGEKEFVQAVQTAHKEVKLFDTQLKGLSEEFENNANSMDYLQKRQELLTEKQSAYQRKLDAAKAGQKQANENFRKIGDRLEELKNQLDEAEKAQKSMEDAGKQGTKEYENQSKAVEVLKKAVEGQTAAHIKEAGSIAEWNQKVYESDKALKKSNNELEQNNQYLKEAEQSSNHCATSIDRMGNKVSDSASDLNKLGDATEETSKKMDDAADASSNMSNNLKNAFQFKAVSVGVDAIKSGVQAVAQYAKEAAEYVVDVGSSFESAMSEVAAISGATGEDLRALEEKAKELGSSTRFSATEAAEALKYMSLAGWGTTDMLNGIDGIMSLAAASGMELAEASDMVTDYLSAFGMQASESAHLADLLAYAQANSNTSAEQLGEAYQNCAADMNAAGQDVETVTSLLEAMANQGTKGSRAGTQLSAMMRDITAKMKDGKISIGDATIAVMDATGNYRDLTDILKDVSKATEGMGDAEKNAALSSTFTADSMKGLNLVLNEGIDKVASYEESLRNSAGASQDMAGIMQDNLSGKLTNMNSAIEGLGIAAYEYVEGPLKGVVEGVTGAINGLTDIISPQKDELGGLCESTAEALENLKQIKEETDNSINNIQETFDSAVSQSNDIGNLGKRLADLNSIEKRTVSQKYEMQAVVNRLSESIPELKGAYDLENDSLNITNTQLKELIENYQQTAITQAAMAASQDLINQKLDAQIQLDKANELKQASEGRLKLLEEERDLINSFINDFGYVENEDQYRTDILEHWKRALDNGTISLEEYNEAIQNIDPSLATERLRTLNDVAYDAGSGASITERSINGLNEEFGNLEKGAYEAEEAVKKYDGAIDNVTQAAKNLNDELKINSDAADKNAKKHVLIAEVGEKVSDALKYAKEAVQQESDAMKENADAAKAMSDAQKTSLQSMMDKYDEITESITSSLQNKINLFEKFEGGTDMTTEDMNKNLNSYIEGVQTYKANLEEVKNMVDENGKALVSPEFFQYIQDMGLEGANMLNHMVYTWENQGEYGIEQIKSMNKKYCDALEMTDEIGKTLAANEMAYEAGIRKLGSTDVEFGNLRDSINYAVMAAAEGWKALPTETKKALDETIATIQQCGGLIPDGLASGIESGEISPQEAINRLNASLEGQFEGLARIAEKNGMEVDKSLRDGIASGGDEAVQAYAGIIELLASHNIDFEEVGKESGSSFGSGAADAIESEADTTKSAAQETVDAARKAVEESAGAYRKAGIQLIEAMSVGMTGEAMLVNSAAGTVASGGAESAKGYEGSYSNAGGMLAQGLAKGITEGNSYAINAAIELAEKALEAAKKVLDIHSPSGTFKREVGEQISKGMAWGINAKAAVAKNASSNLSKQVLNNAVSWMQEYQKKQKTTLGDEKYFWQQVAQNTKKGTSSYKKAQNEIASINKEILQISNNFGVNWTKTTGSGSNQKTEKKSAETYYSEVYQAANKYMNNMKVIRDVSLREEEAYWTAVIKKLKKGTQAWYDAKNQLKSVQNSIKNETQQQQQAAEEEKQEKRDYALSGDALKTYKTYFDVSAQAETEYWNIVRKKFKEGTSEREEADRKYFEAKKSLNEKLKELDDDYYDKVSEVNKKLKDDIEDLEESYNKTVKERADEIYSSTALKDKFESESDSGSTLLYNLKTQVVGLDDWIQQIEKLKAKGIDQELIDELQAMGPEASAMLHVLNNDLPEGMDGRGMTEEQLKEYEALWKEKKKLAEKQAEEENRKLKAENDKKIEELKKQAQKEIETYTAEWNNSKSELQQVMSEPLMNIAEQATSIGEKTVTNYIQGMYNKLNAENQKTASNQTVKSKSIGTNLVDGVIQGVKESATNAAKSMQDLSSLMLEASKKQNKINSPSKVYEDEVGKQIPAGIGQGVKKNAEYAVKPMQNVFERMLESAEAAQREENEKLSEYIRGMRSDAGMERLNYALREPVQSTTVTIDNGTVVALLGQLLTEMQKSNELVSRSGNRKVVLDTGKLVGEIAEPISQEQALRSRARNRGRF